MMGEDRCFLITIGYRGKMLKVALKIEKGSQIPESIMRDLESDESEQWLLRQLPKHVSSCGPILQVEEIFEVTINETTK